MTEALKPCPFCGCECLWIDMFDQIRTYVECHWCDARGPLRDTEAQAISAWNTRAVSELIEAAKALVSALDQCDPHMTNAFAMAYDRMGAAYIGPTFEAELRALREALEKMEKTDEA